MLLYVGRVSHEKGIDDFLQLKTAGTKLVVGDGPARAELEKQYPDAVFLGYRKGQALGEVYAAADLFVFPSKTDTFGIVVIEALASGLPVAAYPVTGPVDIVTRDEARGARRRPGEGGGAGAGDRRPGGVRGRGRDLHLGELHPAVPGEPRAGQG